MLSQLKRELGMTTKVETVRTAVDLYYNVMTRINDDKEEFRLVRNGDVLPSLGGPIDALASRVRHGSSSEQAAVRFDIEFPMTYSHIFEELSTKLEIRLKSEILRRAIEFYFDAMCAARDGYAMQNVEHNGQTTRLGGPLGALASKVRRDSSQVLNNVGITK